MTKLLNQELRQRKDHPHEAERGDEDQPGLMQPRDVVPTELEITDCRHGEGGEPGCAANQGNGHLETRQRKRANGEHGYERQAGD